MAYKTLTFNLTDEEFEKLRVGIPEQVPQAPPLEGESGGPIPLKAGYTAVWRHTADTPGVQGKLEIGLNGGRFFMNTAVGEVKDLLWRFIPERDVVVT